MTFSDIEKISELLGDNILIVVFIVTIFWFCITKLAETKDAVAKLLGPWGKRIQQAKIHRDEMHREEVRREAKRVLRETGNLEPQDYSTIKTRLSNVLEEVGALNGVIKQMQFENRAMRAYIFFDEDWHWDDQRAAIRENRDPSPHKNFDEFLNEFVSKKT